jgi:KDO2-lipid IV(A) lauroyltransferase
MLKQILKAAVIPALAEAMRWCYWFPFRKLVQALPPGALYALARLAAGLAPRLFPVHTLRYLHELECLGLGRGQGERLELARRAFFLRFCLELEVLSFPRLNPGNIGRFVQVEGLERLEAALALGKGAMLVFAHLGANQMVMPALGHRGYKMCQMSAPPTVWTEIFAGRMQSPMRERGRHLRWELEQTLPVTHLNVFGSLKPVFTHLKAGEVLGLALDGGGGKDRMALPFLGQSGQQICLSPGAVRIALKAGCPMLPVLMARTPAGPSRMVIEPPLELVTGRESEESLRANLTLLVARLDDWTRSRPDHYLNYLVWRRVLALQGQPPLVTEAGQACGQASVQNGQTPESPA